MNIDLHCHSDASDGELPPAALLSYAAELGVQLLALTDHDTLAGYQAVAPLLAARSDWPLLLPGIELSASWGGSTCHVVGLAINPDCPGLQAAVARQQQARWDRAAVIARRLEQKLGMTGIMQAVCAADPDSPPNRPAFARYLVAKGVVKDASKAFERWLGNGKIGDVSQQWPQLAEVVQWITAAEGVAVLAHPDSFGFTRAKLGRLVGDFSAAGGQALELAAVQQNAAEAAKVEAVARQAGLAVSSGSDFHGRSQPWRKLGNSRAVPADMQPVWQLPAISRWLAANGRHKVQV